MLTAALDIESKKIKASVVSLLRFKEVVHHVVDKVAVKGGNWLLALPSHCVLNETLLLQKHPGVEGVPQLEECCVPSTFISSRNIRGEQGVPKSEGSCGKLIGDTRVSFWIVI